MLKNKSKFSHFDMLRHYGVTIYEDEEIPKVEKFERDINLRGRLPKNFYLYENTQKSFKDKNAIAGLIKELRTNQQCSYDTYINDLVKEDNYIPKYVSVMVKTSSGQKSANLELLTPKLLNLFGVKTVYNFLDNDEFGVTDNIYSIDMMQKGESFASLGDIGMGRGFLFQYLSNWDRESVGCIKNFFTNSNPEDISNFRLDLFNTYLIRFLLIGDVDMDAYNIGICYNENTNKFRMSGNYDFEFCLGANLKDPIMQSLLQNALLHYNRHFPKELKDMMSKLQNIQKTNIISKLIKSIVDRHSIDSYTNLLNSNMNVLINEYNKLKFISTYEYNIK